MLSLGRHRSRLLRKTYGNNCKLDIRHCIDVMHVEKNGKKKDSVNARLDLVKMGKVTQGYSSNFRKLISMQDLKLVGLKSHDYHVLMQQLLLVAIKEILPKNIIKVLTRLCLFFNVICSKVINL
ncbi:hypothetical protein CR513_21834, partial [Mucuna pruriens]